MTDDRPHDDAPTPSRAIEGGALRALAHPLRVQIYDILSQYGPQTASSLAQMTGESTGSTSYHLRALAKHGLIREAGGRGNARERWWERPPGPVSFGTADGVKTPAGRAATQIVMTEFFNRRHAQLMDFFARSLRSLDHPGEEAEPLSSITTSTVHLTPEQFSEFSGRLSAVVDEYVEKYRDQTGDGVRLFSVRADVFSLPEEGH